MQTIEPTTATDDEVAGHPRTTGDGESLGMAGFAIVLAVLALVVAVTIAVVGGGDGDDGAATGGDAATATVELSEFALSPAALTVAAGGELAVTNAGGVAHNLAIGGTDIATTDLDAGASETLDLSGLEPGDYEVVCTIPGHADSGMTGTLTVTTGEAGGGGSGLAATEDPATAGSGGGGSGGGGDAHAGHGTTMSDEEMAEMSEAMDASVLAYPAATEGAGNQELEPTVAADGTKVFELSAEVVPWEVEPGVTVDAWAYNGMVPGPVLRAEIGDRVRVELTNDLPMATDLHLHGINLPNDMDGVAPLTQDAVQPGETFAYEFTADEVAVAMYHAHHHGQLQVPNGLLGTLLVGEVDLPRGRTVGDEVIPADLEVAQEMPLVLNDSGTIGYSLNGKSFPATEPVTAQQGDWVLVHYLNEGSQIHPMHLHQFDQVVVAKDGFALDHPYVADTVNVAPGERYSVLVQLDQPGTWVWHCHILNHVERDTGMYGMVTAVIVE